MLAAFCAGELGGLGGAPARGHANTRAAASAIPDHSSTPRFGV